MSFYEFLSEKRKAVPTPENVIDENGKCHFGTFDKEFQKMDFLKVKHPSALPDLFNKSKLTLWEAAEINFGEVVLLTAVCDMALFGTSLTVLYDTKTKKCACWQEMLFPASKAVIAKNLLGGSRTYSRGKKVNVGFINDFGNGKATVYGSAADGEAGEIEYRVRLTRVSKPSVVMIPFGENRPLYSQKDLFSAEGYIEWNGKRYEADGATAIIDDHRGYYPRRAHYDWVTTMGKREIDGKELYFGFNLTRNQSIDQDDYNENLIWFEGDSALLTPVTFEHETETLWHVTDEHGMVDLRFDIGDEFLMALNIGVVVIDYHITFGSLSGYVCDPEGNKYLLDGMNAVGEDKTLVF